MNAETMRDGETRAVRIEGEMTIYRALELKEQLLAALAPGGGLELDLSGVTEVDSAGVQLLLAARKTAPLRIAERSHAVAEAFATLGLDACFDAPYEEA